MSSILVSKAEPKLGVSSPSKTTLIPAAVASKDREWYELSSIFELYIGEVISSLAVFIRSCK